ncbi:MAG: hypothetical protein AAF242_01535 [Bacteroidota bacterium]
MQKAGIGSIKDGLSSVKENWIIVDNFESSNAIDHWILEDVQNDTKPRIANPQVTEVGREASSDNHFLIKKPAADGIIGNRKALSYKRLPVAVEVGETYTFYLRFNVEYFPNNHVFGLSDLRPEGINTQAYDALEPSLRITDKYESDGTKNDGTLMVRRDKGYAKIRNKQAKRAALPLEPNTWYEVWMVVNNASRAEGGQSYDVYLKGGREFPEQVQVYSQADFRMQREQALIYFLTNCNTGPIDNPYGNGGLRYDDLYMAKGILLSKPKF